MYHSRVSDIAEKHWQFWIDRGGTFTDIVALRSDGLVSIKKLLSEDPAHYQDAAREGIERIINSDSHAASSSIKQIKMGTTVATNALLERKGVPTMLVVNRGFADILRIGYQARPNLFARHIKLPENLYCRVAELKGRLDATGKEIEPLDAKEVRARLKEALDAGIESLAIVFMHSYLNDVHEKECLEIAQKLGFKSIALSSRTSPLIKIVFRGDTTVADAYLTPVLNRYIDRFTGSFSTKEKTRIYFMQSNGGLVDKVHFSGKDSLLSGPAGGVVGAARTCMNIGFEKVIGFDMGGTSTDVSHYNGEYEIRDENIIAGVRVRTPVIDINTVAAGGGSIVSFDGQRFRVGPDSAGADPGPACYRKGGPLTITDCNLLLGRIQKDFFPRVFGPQADEPLDIEIVKAKFDELLKLTGEKIPSIEAIAWGFIEIAVEKMAQAIKKVTIERGYDIKDHVLSSFGGAGGQHACLIAERLGIKTVVIHPLAGVLSAVGIGLSDIKAVETKSIQKLLSECNSQFDLEETFNELAAIARAKIEKQVDEPFSVNFKKKVLIRYQGSDTSLELPLDAVNIMEASFHDLHKRRYGFCDFHRALIVDALRLEADCPSGTGDEKALLKKEPAPNQDTPQVSMADTEIYSKGSFHQCPVLRREELDNKVLVGPLLIIDDTGTNIIEPGWQVEKREEGSLILSRIGANEKRTSEAIETDFEADAIKLELFNNKFMAIAEEMGVTLRNTSHSVNIKERLDFSCALFDDQGRLIANAPHMPVHLGSMGASVQAVIESFGDQMQPGDAFILNDPYKGGTHLPDITVISPVFIGDDDNSHPCFYTASRGHHADVGGITPGSMPPNSRTIEEEGVLISPSLLVKNERFLETEMRSLLSSGPHPARNIDQNLADLKAQVAANKTGITALEKLVEQYGLSMIQSYMSFVRDNAEFSVRKTIESLEDGSFSLPLDNGATIKVSIEVDKKNHLARIDFTGTSQEQENNFNAPSSITRAAVLYVFRTLVEDQIPLNDGCLSPLEIIIPEGSLLNPTYPRAVVAGNVETSQAVVDALYGALGVLAASQGTMNNFTFGNSSYQYYETICGGSGAGPNHPGTAAVQTHMTNSRLTDPEVLEFRYPVLLRRFAIRKESGGKGRHNGGDGVIREIEFKETMQASILSQRRAIAPFGLVGGEPAACGKNYVIRRSGKVVQLTGTDSIEMAPGDRFVIETPGGGGYGSTK